jgi:hypothetical protein
LYLLVSLVGNLQEIHDVGILQDYTSQGTTIRILIWDLGIGVIGSPEFDGVKIRVEWLLGELTEDWVHTIILLIRSIWVSCVVSTWRGHVLRRAHYRSHKWIWDLGITYRLIHYCLRTSNILVGRTVMSPFLDIIILQSVMLTRVARWG